MNEVELPVHFGEWLKCRRKELDLTQTELAQRVGCSVAALRKIEAGDRRASKQLAGLLAQAVDIPTEDQATFIKVARGELNLERLRSPLLISAPDRAITPEPAERRNNLPFQPTPLIGRETELATLGALLADPHCRLLTLTGLGGIGKTRLAIAAASANQALFPDGVAFVAIAGLTSPAFLATAIADAAGFNLAGSENPEKQLFSALHDKRLLLVLDNAETLLDEVGLFSEMLKSAPLLKLLVTSREHLNLLGEWVFDVQGLPVPAEDEGSQVEQYSSVALFVQRARQIQLNFQLGVEDLPWVAHICRMVEGMPLGIELAAAWVSMLTCREIAEEIERSLDFLSASLRDLPERQRSMRVVLDYSWQMLSADEQKVLRQLSVFQGGFNRQAAEQVACANLPILSTLVNRTLLRRTSAGRYDLHELVRQYGLAQLAADSQEYAAVEDRHYTFFLSLVQASIQGMQRQDQLEWLERLEQDHDNLRAALAWALNRREGLPAGDELALQLAGSLRWFWRMRGHFHEGRDWFTEALLRSPESRTVARASALLGLSLINNGLGYLGEARPLAEESAEIYRQLGDQEGLAEALMLMGLTLVWEGEAAVGRARLEESLSIYRQSGDRWGEAQALYRLGSSLADYGGDLSGREMLQESAAILEDLGEKYVFVSVLTELGIVEMGLGNYSMAQTHFERSLAFARVVGHPWGMANAMTNLGGVFRILGEYTRAQSILESSRAVYQEHGHSIWETDVLCALAENAMVQGDFSSARSYLEAAALILETSENQWLQTLLSYFWGLLAYYEGDTGEAARWLGETTTLAREGQYKPDLARSLVALARVRRTLGDMAAAGELVQEGLALYRSLEHKLGIATALEEMASLHAAQGDGRQAAVLLGAAQALREAIDAPIPPADLSAHEATIALSRSKIGEAAFVGAWMEGKQGAAR